MITVTIVYTIGYTVASITQLWIHLINICFNSYTAIITSVQNIETEVILSTTTQKKNRVGKKTQGVRKRRKKGGGWKNIQWMCVDQIFSWLVLQSSCRHVSFQSHKTLCKCNIKCCSLGAHDSYLVYWDMTDCATHCPCNRTPLARVLEILPCNGLAYCCCTRAYALHLLPILVLITDQ